MNKTKNASPLKKQPTTGSSLFRNVTCPLCSNNSYSVLREGTFPKNMSEEFLSKIYRSSSDEALFEQVAKCKLCNLTYLNPRLDPDIIVQSYAEGEDVPHVAQDTMRIRTFEKALKHLAKKYTIALTKKIKILDIGCAGGAFLKAAENIGMTSIGIEPNRWMSQYAKDHYGLDVRAGVLSEHKFPDAFFDVVTLWDVIEHVPEPEFELKEIYRILKPGGLLVVNYPDYASLPARLLGKKWPFWLSVHLTYYTPETIKKHLEKCQYTVEAIDPHWQTLELGYVLKRIAPYFSFANVIKHLIEKIGLGAVPLTYWVGQTQVVARKAK